MLHLLVTRARRSASRMPFVAVTGRQIEYRMIPGDHARPTLVFLHEGIRTGPRSRSFTLQPPRGRSRVSC